MDSRSHSDLLETFLRRVEDGEAPDFEEFVREYPDQEQHLRAAWADWCRAMGALEQGEADGELRELRRGMKVGEFLLVECLGRGGQGSVWRAQQPSLGREVALKLLRPDRVAGIARERFRREARAGARLSHPNLVQVHGFGEAGGVSWLAQELVPGGRTLDARLAELKQQGSRTGEDFREIAEIVACVAEALQAIHDEGILHRDVKPQNVLLTRAGVPKLTDFGLARITTESALSTSGEMAGTVLYMSPEQVRARHSQVGPRSDIFSLGVVLYELLTLRRPFEGETIQQVCNRILSTQAVAPQRHDSHIPRDLALISGKAMRKDPRDRYATAADMAADLRAFLDYRPIAARPASIGLRTLRWTQRNPVLAGAVGVLVILASLSGILLQELQASERPKEIESRLDRAYLAYFYDKQAAEQVLRGVLDEFDAHLEDEAGLREAAVSLGQLLVARGETKEALDLTSELLPRLQLPALRLVRLHALRRAGRFEDADALQAQMGDDKSSLCLYVEALELLEGRPNDGSTGTLLQREERAQAAFDLLDTINRRPGDRRPSFFLAAAHAVWRGNLAEEGKRIAEDIETAEWGDEPIARFCRALAIEKSRRDEALEIYRRLVDELPDLHGPAMRLGHLLVETDDYAEGLELIESVVRMDPTLRRDLATAHYTVGLRTGASEHLEQAVSLAAAVAREDPGDVIALDTQGTALILLRRYAEAVVPLQQALELEPTASRIASDIGLAYIHMGDFEEAKRFLYQALEQSPDMFTVLGNLGGMALEEGDSTLAADYAADAIEAARNAHDRCDGLVLHAQALMQGAMQGAWDRGALVDAEADLLRAIEERPDNPEAHSLLCTVHQLLGRAADRLAAAEAWTEACPDDAGAWNELGWVLVDPGGETTLHDVVRGLEAAERAVRLSHYTQPEYLDTLAWAYQGAGDSVVAKETIEEALIIARRDPSFHAMLPDLERSRHAIQELSQRETPP